MTDKKTNNFFNRKAHAMKTSIANLISRFVLDTADDGKQMQEVKGELFSEETKDELEHFQSYGFTSVPPGGSEGVALSVNGNRDHVIVINIDNRQFRLKNLAKGEVALYNDQGAHIILKANGNIELKCNTFKIDATEVEFVQQNTTLNTIKSTYNSHTHPETGSVTTAPNQPI